MPRNQISGTSLDDRRQQLVTEWFDRSRLSAVSLPAPTWGLQGSGQVDAKAAINLVGIK